VSLNVGGIPQTLRFDPFGPAIVNDPDTVYLPKFEVEDRPLPRGLAEAIEKSRFAGPQNKSRLGTGIHEKDFGKVRGPVVTVFYIPIFAGLSW
jgi:hypothetical protein